MRLYTIGFTKKPAEIFFGLLRRSEARCLIDVRLNNASQLAGFARKADLPFLVRELCGMEYHHLPELAPTEELLSAYRKKRIDWRGYEREFLALMRERRIEERIPKELLADGCLLCSEHRPHHCHRRLIAEYLDERWGGVEVLHLV